MEEENGVDKENYIVYDTKQWNDVERENGVKHWNDVERENGIKHENGVKLENGVDNENYIVNNTKRYKKNIHHFFHYMIL